MTLPAGWIENPADEGQQGAQAAFALEFANGRDSAYIDGDFLPLTMSPHDAVEREAAYTPGSGTVSAKGDCRIGASQASFFESSFSFELPPFYQLESGGYVLYIAHRKGLVRLIVLFSAATRASSVPQAKSILGSWQWDQP